MAKEKTSRDQRRARTKPEELPALPAAASEAATTSATPEGGDGAPGIGAAAVAPPAGPEALDAAGEPLGPFTDPLLAAPEAGRLLNRLSFHLQHVWFLRDSYHESEVKVVAGRLSLCARVLAPADQRADLQAFIHDTVEGLRRQYQSEDHSDWVEGELDDLDGRCYTEIDARGVVLETVFTSLSRIRQAIRQHVEGQVALAFQLGELVDQGACPPRVYRHLDYRPPAPAPATTRRWADALDPRPLRHQPQPRYSPRRPGDVPPWPDWAEHVEQVWAELRLPALPTTPLATCSASPTEEEAARARVTTVDRLAGLAREGLRQLAAPSPSPSTDKEQEAPQPEPRGETGASAEQAVCYLGLIFNERQRVVRRDGYPGEVSLEGSTLAWCLLEHLCEQGDDFSSVPDLRQNVWQNNDDLVREGTIHKAISVLRGLLKPLGATIENKRSVGYRLREVKKTAKNLGKV
jgi:DNA-binding winged helix-turn-helix (wHTH) protein